MSVEQQTIIEAMAHKRVFGPMFKPAGLRRWFGGDSWAPWKSFLRSLFALQPGKDDMAIYKACTGRTEWPARAAREAWLAAGRRGGKSRIASLLCAYLACFRDYRALLSPGEWAVVACIASDRRQAQVIFQYTRALLAAVPMLQRRITSETAESIELGADRVKIEVHTSSYRAVRGYSIGACVCDEIAYWRDENSANPAKEILAAIRPGMATIPGSMLICVSSPYSRHGVLWETYQRHFGKDSDILVWQAASRTMNSTIPQSVIDEAMESDPQTARSEYLGEFRDDLASFVNPDALAACVVPGRYELPVAGVSYEAFIDPSGGSSDSMAMAIAHADAEGRAILDCIRETRPPFSPESVTAEFARELKRYRIFSAASDRYGAEWVRESFSKNGIDLRPSERNKSELYLAFLPMVNSRQVELLDHPRMLRQIEQLERRTHAGGKDTVDHPASSNLHDDLANVCAGALTLVSGAGGTLGMVELLKKIESGEIDPDKRAVLTTARPAPPPPQEQTGKCPKCGSACVIVIPGNGRHCNACSWQWWADGKGPEVTVAGFRNGRPQVYTRRVQ